jgi:hypothetical protein
MWVKRPAKLKRSAGAARRTSDSPNFQSWRYRARDVAGAAMIDGGAAIIPTELAPAEPVGVPPKPDDPASMPPETEEVCVPSKPDDAVTPTEPPADPAGVPTADDVAAACASTVVADGAMIDGAAIVPTEVTPADDTAGTVQPIMPGVVLVVVPIVMLVVVPVVMPAVAPVVITAVAPVVMLVVGPGVRPKGQDPVRLLVVVPAGKGDKAGMGVGEGSVDPAALVPM